MFMHAIEGIMGVTMEKIREMVDVNTIIGEPITTPDNTTIIPVSKVSFGFASGGSDIPSKVPKDVFGGGAGAGVSIQPLAFLVVSGGNVRLLQMTVDSNAVNSVINTVPEVIDKISGLVSSKGKNKDSE
ncbi:MAG: GerW family sporulation protein [Oscillospiraceae bacterium]